MTDVDKLRIHTLHFSEEEYRELNTLLAEDNNDAYIKGVFPVVWLLLNRMSYTAAHGTEEGWSDGN